MKTIYKVLRFFNLIDRSNDLSITNIILITVVIRLVIAPVFSLEECGVLMLALLNYAHKRHEAAKVDRSMFQSMNVIKAEVESFKKELAEVKAVSEEAKDKVSKLSTANGLKQLNGRG